MGALKSVFHKFWTSEVAVKVLVVGCDLSSQGGIASVVKLFFRKSESSDISYSLIKTSNYIHGSKLTNAYMLIVAVCKFLRLIWRSDLVHIQGSSHISFYRKLLFVFLARLFNKPVVWNFHASRFEDFFRGRKGLVFYFIKFSLNSADLIIVLSEKFKDILTAEYGFRNVRVLRNPAESRLFDLKNNSIKLSSMLHSNPLRFLFIGFFIKSKGVEDLLEVASSLRSDPSLKFIFAGKGELAPAIDEVAKVELSNVENLGWLDFDQKMSALKMCDVLVLPSYKEGMPMVILEAMALGIPIIATNIAAIPEQVTHGREGLLYEPGDLCALKNCILSMKDHHFREMCSKRCLSKIEMYSEDTVFRELTEIYQEVIK